jgi:signal transduction histidine kinase
MKRRMLPDSLFGRLLTAMLAAIGVTLVIVVGLLLQERRDSLFSRSETAAVVTAIAGTAKTLAGLRDEERRAELERLRRESVVIAGQSAPRLPEGRDDLRQAARQLRTRLERQLGGDYAISVAPARPGPADVIAVRAERGARFELGPTPRSNGGRGGGPEQRDDRFRGRGPGGPGGPARELDVLVTLPDGDVVTFRADAPQPAPPLPLPLLLELVFVALVLAAVLYAMARTITRPLAELAAAAEAVGRGGRSPLRETGARELREATRAFNAMQERLHRYLDSRTRVLSAMSHDLRTPLTRLKLRAESLDDDSLRERFNSDLDEMQRMVTGALNLFRGMNHDEPLQAVDVDALVAELRAEQAELGVAVEVTGSAVAPVSARPTALKRCIGNLLSNAAKYGTKPAIAIEDGPNELVLRVLDDGPGIPPEMLEQVFEPFFRLESSRNADTGGVGLGLAIARDLAQAHGGSLTLRNRAPRGLEATLRLPRAAAT